MSWPMVKLSEVATIINGRAYKQHEMLDKGKYPLMRVGNFFSNREWYYSDLELPERQYCDNGDLLYAWSASFGPRIWDGGKVIYHYHIWKVELNEKLVDKKYLYYALQRDVEFIKKEQGSGSTMVHVTKSAMENRLIPLPPLAEQKRIAAILDKADAIRRKRQQAIQLADDFLRAVFLQMFGDPVTNPKGWEVKPLKDVLKSISSGWSANGDSRPCEEGELGVLKISAVTSGTFIPTENKAVKVSDIPSSKKLVFPKKGDMLFSRANTRELVAASCIVVEDSLNTFLPDKLWLIKTDESQLLPEFLNYLLKIPGFKEKLTSQATGSSGSMLNISMGKFEQTGCLIPPIDLQHRFKNLYWKFQETMSCFEQSYSTLQASFNSLSQKAFSGQL